MNCQSHRASPQAIPTAPSQDKTTQTGETKPQRLLLLEDSADDAVLISRVIKSEWPKSEVVVVADRIGFESAIAAISAEKSPGGYPDTTLRQPPYDLILSDYCFPAYSGREALARSRELAPQVPFIFISGLIGDEIAVESLKAGATDYVLKDRLSRLVPVIKRALTESQERARRQRAEAARHKSESQVEQSNRELRKKNEEIQNFYHTLSHELKTPLTSASEFI